MRRAPCPCPACNFQIQDERTVVQRLRQSRTNITNSVVSTPTVTPPGTSSLSLNPESPFLMDDHSLTSEHSNPVLDIPEAKVYEYVMKKLKLKLDRDHSVTDIEEHLKNAADLVGGKQIPTTWSNVLKLLKKLGYTNPYHYKVCASHDHSFLLRSREEHPTCGVCGKQWQDCIDYYCLGLNFMDCLQ